MIVCVVLSSSVPADYSAHLQGIKVDMTCVVFYVMFVTKMCLMENVWLLMGCFGAR